MKVDLDVFAADLGQLKLDDEGALVLEYVNRRIPGAERHALVRGAAHAAVEKLVDAALQIEQLAERINGHKVAKRPRRGHLSSTLSHNSLSSFKPCLATL